MRTSLTILLAIIGFATAAQSQDLVKLDKEKVDFENPWNILLYIIFPILLAIFYISWSKSKRKEREEERKNKNKES